MVLLLLLLLSNLTHADQRCAATQPLLPSQMTPEGIKAWMAGTGSKISSIDDFICCLPKSYQSDIEIAPLSIAGQNGSPMSPRVFMKTDFGQTDIVGKSAMVLTANGGAPDLNQSQSIEIAYYRHDTKKLEFYDFNFAEKKPQLSGKNPDACMACHGDESAQEPAAGPRPIFEPFGHWPRFVGGAKHCNAIEDKLQVLVQKKAVASVEQNPRFRCLDKNSLTTLRAEAEQFNANRLSSFDSALFDINSKRVAHIVRETPDYESYKYALVGIEKCTPFSVEAWIPPRVLALHTNESSISSDVAHIRNEADFKSVLEARKKEAQQARAGQARLLNDPDKLFKEGFEPSSSAFSCDNDENRNFVPSLPAIEAMFKNPTVRAYLIEQSLTQPPLQIRGNTAFLPRFIFEGRGLSMRRWIEDVHDDYRTGIDFTEELIRLEPANSELSKIMKTDEAEKSKSGTSTDSRKCQALQKASLKALSALAKRKNLPSEQGKASR